MSANCLSKRLTRVDIAAQRAGLLGKVLGVNGSIVCPVCRASEWYAIWLVHDLLTGLVTMASVTSLLDFDYAMHTM